MRTRCNSAETIKVTSSGFKEPKNALIELCLVFLGVAGCSLGLAVTFAFANFGTGEFNRLISVKVFDVRRQNHRYS